MAQANTERLGGVKLTGRRRKMDEISVNGNHDRGPITGSQSVHSLSLSLSLSAFIIVFSFL